MASSRSSASPNSVEALQAWRRLNCVETLRTRECHGGCPVGPLVGQLAETCPDYRQELADGFVRWEDPIRRDCVRCKTAAVSVEQPILTSSRSR